MGESSVRDADARI